jgi:hypothetical protein
MSRSRGQHSRSRGSCRLFTGMGVSGARPASVPMGEFATTASRVPTDPRLGRAAVRIVAWAPRRDQALRLDRLALHAPACHRHYVWFPSRESERGSHSLPRTTPTTTPRSRRPFSSSVTRSASSRLPALVDHAPPLGLVHVENRLGPLSSASFAGTSHALGGTMITARISIVAASPPRRPRPARRHLQLIRGRRLQERQRRQPQGRRVQRGPTLRHRDGSDVLATQLLIFWGMSRR